jgi:hypothetical protein
MRIPLKRRLRDGCAIAILGFAVLQGPAIGQEQTTSPDWAPKASEKLVRLPAAYLKRSIDRDFAGSGLASAIRAQSDKVSNKKRTVAELQEASGRADGAARIELRHQALVEKQQLVRLLGERAEFERREWETRIRLYQGLLRSIERKKNALGPEALALLDKQEAAQQRMAAVSTQVDTALLGTGGEQSRYSAKYNAIQSAKQKLIARINGHPMNQQPEIDGKAVDRKTYLSRLSEDGESMLALLKEEETVLAFMGKLVALDAMALSEDVAETRNPDDVSRDPERHSVSASADIFLN